MMDATVNLNSTKCLATINDIGSTTIRNICTGVETVIPWGSADWAGAAAITFLLACGGALLVGLIIGISRV